MPRSVRHLWLMVLTVVSGWAQGAQLLTQVTEYGHEGDAVELEVGLDLPVALASPFVALDARTWEARLLHRGAPALDWQTAELSLEGEYEHVDRVTVEGATHRGFVVRIRFAEPVAVVTLPQHASDRIILKYLPRRQFRRAADASDDTPDREAPWAIDLGTDAPILDIGSVPRALLINRSLYYVPDRHGALRARLGFFDAAGSSGALRQARGPFPAAKLVRVTHAEAAYAKRMQINSERVARLYAGTSDPVEDAQPPRASPGLSIDVASAPDQIDGPAPGRVSELKAWRSEPDDSLLTEARNAYLAGDYDRAVALYTKASHDPGLRAQALELLGATREQNGQTAHAKQVYETVLQEFPGTEIAGRVEGRLRTLVSIDQAPASLRLPERRSALAWNVVGNVSQFYRRHSIDIENRGTTVPIDGLFTDAFVSVQRHGPRASHEARMSVGHLQDFSDRDDGRTLRIQELYWDSRSEPLRAGVRVGRQRQRRSGVLGRFDGVTASWLAADNVEVNALGGYLVDSSYDDPDSRRRVWGLNAEIDLLDDRLGLVPFYVQQSYDGVLDRQAVGLQADYLTDRASYFGMIDYDLHHQVLNHLLVNGNLRLGGRTRVYGGIDHRRNPYLTTRNALIGQATRDLSELELLLVEASLEDIARDRSALSTMLRLGLQGPLGDGWNYSMDASLTDYQATESSLDVAALDAHRDAYYSVQVRANDLFGRGNYGAIQARVYDSDTSRAMGLYVNNRLAFGDAWWLFPRLQLDQRTQLDTNRDQLRIRPSLRLDYRRNRHVRFELEAGYEWTDRELLGGSLVTEGIFLRAGYRASF